LNLPNDNYGLKTGTSHDYTDSWVVGYTPDFIIGVWVGNADSSPTDSVSGQKGAGTIWNDVMQVMYNSTYNKNTAFDFSDIQEYQGKNGVEFGLPDDDFESAENIIKDQDNAFIMSPHRNDVFLFIADTEISLEAKESAEWFINGEKYLTGKKVFFSPTKSGTYTILAKGSGASETISIKFIDSYNKN